MSATDTINLLSDTAFFGRPYFTTDTAGFAVVSKDGQSVDVKYDREYIETPIVNATVSFDSTDSNDDVLAYLASDEKFIVASSSKLGFTIKLNKKATGNIRFAWQALAVKGAKVFTMIPETTSSQNTNVPITTDSTTRSEERRVGKECRL